VSELREDVADYDEFEALQGYCEWSGVPWNGRPPVRRVSIEAGTGQRLSMLEWYGSEPEVVYLHGGGQNAHTWDTVAMAVGRPALAVDLPGHGHSSWREDRDYWPWSNAEAIAALMERHAPNAAAVVGMSLGGLTTIRLAGSRPDLTRRAVVVDVTPGVGARSVGLTVEERGAVAVIGGPPEFESFDAMLDALAASMPARPRDSLVPGLRHNATMRDDGKWIWRHDLGSARRAGADAGSPPTFEPLWDDLEASAQPILLVKGGASKFVHDDDLETFRARAPHARIEVVEGAGHSIQSDRPVQLAALVGSMLAT